jgi:type VI secretion system protein ImpK
MHREAWGGEKFFDMLESISRDPARYVDLMELQYLLLTFGFAGKYGEQAPDRGSERLLDVQQDLYRKIRAHRGATEDALSLRWRGVEDRRNPLVRYIPWWVVGAAALLILAVTFTTYYTRLAQAAAPVHADLAKVGLEDFSPPPEVVPPPRRLTLKQLLVSDEQAGRLKVEEQGARTRVTLLGQDLFPSGSATVNPAYTETLERLTDALNQVPGRVLVEGHTDDQPIRSLRYDNYQLSRERAEGVAAILRRRLDSRVAMTVIGKGLSEPRYTPASTPENRSLNRRVEIIHVQGT